MNGVATVSQLPASSLPGLIAQGVSDINPEKPYYIPLANNTGENGALTQAGALAGYQFIQANPPPPGNVFAARFVLQLPFFGPDASAASSKIPTYIGVGLTDNNVSPNATLKLAARFPAATLYKYPGGHFDPYPTKPDYPANLANQVAFLKKHVSV